MVFATLGGLGYSSSAQAQQFWKTDGTGGTWTGSNWGTSAAGPFSTAYTANSSAQFTADSTVTFATVSIGNVTVADNRTVTVTQAGTLSTNGAVRTFDVGTGSLLTWSTQNWSTTAGVGFIKSGLGTWDIGAQSNALNATNGGFSLNAGTVIVSGNNSFGGAASLLTINGGTIQSSGTRAYASNIALGGNFTNSGTGNATFAGTVGLGGATRTITNSTTSGSRIYSGLISGTSGSGLTFNGAGAGQTYIGNVGNTFTGTISINGGEVGFASNEAFGDAANTIVIDGGRLTASTTAGAVATYTLASTHAIQVGASANTAISIVSGGALTYDGVIANSGAFTGSWSKQGSGTLALGGVSTYSGSTSINNGILQLTTGNDRLPTGTVVSLGQAASTSLGTLDLNGRNQTIAGLQSTTGTNALASTNIVTSATAATLTINNSSNFSYSDGTAANSGIISGAISVIKNGNGTQTFGGANTYTGFTTVNAGTLNVTGTGSLASPQYSIAALATLNSAGPVNMSSGVSTVNGMLGGTGLVTVASGATLQGTGTIGNATTVNGSLNPGNPSTSIGTLNFTGNLTLRATSLTTFQIADNLTGQFDVLNGSGTITFGGTLALDNAGYFGTANLGESVTIFSGWTSRIGNFTTFTGLDLGNGLSWDTSNLNSTGQLSVITAVPEPGTIALLAMAGIGGVLYRRRQSKRKVAVHA